MYLAVQGHWAGKVSGPSDEVGEEATDPTRVCTIAENNTKRPLCQLLLEFGNVYRRKRYTTLYLRIAFVLASTLRYPATA
jgi:hypothetical protein